jgi:hypothetical protein
MDPEVVKVKEESTVTLPKTLRNDVIALTPFCMHKTQDRLDGLS